MPFGCADYSGTRAGAYYCCTAKDRSVNTSSAGKKEILYKGGLATIFENGAHALSRPAAVAALKRFGFGKKVFILLCYKTGGDTDVCCGKQPFRFIRILTCTCTTHEDVAMSVSTSRVAHRKKCCIKRNTASVSHFTDFEYAKRVKLCRKSLLLPS